MALSTDFVLRTGPYDHTGKKPKDDEEGKCYGLEKATKLIRSQVTRQG